MIGQDAEYEASRPPNAIRADHPARSMSTTGYEGGQPPIPREADHRVRSMATPLDGRLVIGGRSSWARESKIFRVLPPIAFFRVYAERRETLADDVRRVVSEFSA